MHQEKRVALNLDTVFTTDLIINDMLPLYSKKEYVNYVKIGFPAIIREELLRDSKRNAVKKTTGFIEFVFAGMFYKEIRNPRYLYHLFYRLPDNYRLHILGGGLEEEMAEMIRRLGNRLILHGWVGNDVVIGTAVTHPD